MSNNDNLIADVLPEKMNFEKSGGKRKKNKKSDFIKKENKSCTISAFRVEPSLYKKFEDKLIMIGKGQGGEVKKSDYLINLLIKDLDGEIDYSSMAKKNDIKNELRNLALQISKIGNNINKITYGINAIIRNKSSNLSLEEKDDIVRYYDLLKIASERFFIVTRKIVGMKL